MSDAADIEAIVDSVLADDPSAIANFRKGAKQAIGFLVGEAMRASHGRANPQRVREILLTRLGRTVPRKWDKRR